MPVTLRPVHSSVRAELPHTALALGGDDQTLVGVRVADRGTASQCTIKRCIRRQRR